MGDALVFELQIEEERAGDGDEDGLGEDVGDVAVDGGGLVGGEDADGGLGVAEAAGGDVLVEMDKCACREATACNARRDSEGRAW